MRWSADRTAAEVVLKEALTVVLEKPEWLALERDPLGVT